MVGFSFASQGNVQPWTRASCRERWQEAHVHGRCISVDAADCVLNNSKSKMGGSCAQRAQVILCDFAYPSAESLATTSDTTSPQQSDNKLASINTPPPLVSLAKLPAIILARPQSPMKRHVLGVITLTVMGNSLAFLVPSRNSNFLKHGVCFSPNKYDEVLSLILAICIKINTDDSNTVTSTE